MRATASFGAGGWRTFVREVGIPWLPFLPGVRSGSPGGKEDSVGREWNGSIANDRERYGVSHVVIGRREHG